MTPAPFTDGADLQTDWFFDHLENNYGGVYFPETHMDMIFCGGECRFYYEGKIVYGRNWISVTCIAGDLTDADFFEQLIDELVGDILENKCETLTCEIEKHYYIKNPFIKINFYYKD